MARERRLSELRAMEAEQRFQPFQTGKKHGTGFGLAIVKQVIEAHGGEIRATSESAPGARFEMRLPMTGAR